MEKISTTFYAVSTHWGMAFHFQWILLKLHFPQPSAKLCCYRNINIITLLKQEFMSYQLRICTSEKYTWTSPDGKTHNQIDLVLIDRRWHSSVLEVRRFRGADCDTDHYLVIAKVRKRLAVGKQAAQKFDRQRFNLKLNELEVREQYQIEITNRFAALENLNDDDDVNRTWENIKENIQTSVKESLGLDEFKQNKS